MADSLASGIGLLIGFYATDIFGEARRSLGGAITIDFLAAKATEGRISRSMAAAIAKYREALPELCKKQGASIDDFKTLTARYSGELLNRRIIVTIQDRIGRCYADEYVGAPARHVKVTDRLGRIRTRRGVRQISADAQ